MTGVAVNLSGKSVDDLPTADIDQNELTALLAKKGTFVASAVSDFVLDAGLEVSSERASTVTLVACERVVNASNAALTAFFRDEYERQERYRAEQRRLKLEAEVEERRAKEAEAAEAVREARAAREAAPPPPPQFPTSRYSYDEGGYR